MRNSKFSSSTARLVSLVQYLALKSQSKNEHSLYSQFVINEFEKGSCLQKLVAFILNLNLGAIFWWIEQKLLPGFMNHVRIRKEIIFRTVESRSQNSNLQFVILGAGLDRLGIWIAKNYSSIKVFEVDHPLTQASKQRQLAKVPNNFNWIQCDFSKDSFREQLQASGFQTKVPTFVLWEGVTMYLKEEEVKASLIEISKLGDSVELMFTFVHQREDGDFQFYKAPPYTDVILKKIGEPFLWGHPRENIQDLLSQHGWKLQKLWTEQNTPGLANQSEALVLATKL